MHAQVIFLPSCPEVDCTSKNTNALQTHPAICLSAYPEEENTSKNTNALQTHPAICLSVYPEEENTSKNTNAHPLCERQHNWWEFMSEKISRGLRVQLIRAKISNAANVKILFCTSNVKIISEAAFYEAPGFQCGKDRIPDFIWAIYILRSTRISTWGKSPSMISFVLFILGKKMNRNNRNNKNNNSETDHSAHIFSLVATIFALAGPTMLEQLLQTAVQYIDTAMVGSLGTAATAAVGSTTTVNWLIGSSISAFGVGFLAYISQAYGAGNMDKVRKASGQAVFMVLFVGVFFTIVTLGVSPYVPAWMQVDPEIRSLASHYFFILYLPMLFRTASTIFGTVLRAAGDTKTPMKVGIVVNLTNVVLNTLLIFESSRWNIPLMGGKSISVNLPGAGLGVIGAAIASAIAFTVGGMLMFLAVYRHKDLSPKGVSILPDREVLMPCLKVALPNMLQRFCTSLGYVFFAAMINSLGEVSTAAHTIANTVESAFYIPGYGMMTAAATLTGNAIGAHDRKRQQETSRAIICMEVSMMILSGGLLFIFAPQMTSIFTHSEEVITLCSTVLRMVAVSEPFYGISIVIEGMLQGAGETVRPFRYSVSSMWGVRILGTFICIHFLHFGLISAWGCMIGNNLLLCALFVQDWKKHSSKLI